MDFEQFKAAQRQIWAEGDYPPVGRLLEPGARILVEVAGVTEGQRVLDVGTGTGNVAVLAAQAGAQVIGIDITDAWFDEARARARAEAVGVEVELCIGDAEIYRSTTRPPTWCSRTSARSSHPGTISSPRSWSACAVRAAPSP